MSNLYNNLSEIYEMMYTSFINYEEEYLFYSKKLSNYRCKSLIEIGCGTGRLANRFVSNGFQYTGLDMSIAMLNIAEKNNPGLHFIQEDMRNFDLADKVNACIITGRTLSYLLTDKDVSDTFTAIHNNLDAGGILCFDFIDAGKFIPLIKYGKKLTHTAGFQNGKFHRESSWSVVQNGLFDWQSVFYEEAENGRLERIGEDNSVLRSFTGGEIDQFLRLNGFSVKEIAERPSYAFDTLVATAQKV
jgi:SAM-dependent methyltransferase